jgi:hypothetical protein
MLMVPKSDPTPLHFMLANDILHLFAHSYALIALVDERCDIGLFQLAIRPVLLRYLKINTN